MAGHPGRWAAGLLLGLPLALLLAGQLGGLAGTPPADLGVREGRLRPPSATANSVSSQAMLHPGHPMQQAAMIEPLRVPGTPAAAIDRVARAALALPGARPGRQQDGYLWVQFSTRWLGFVDDAEFWADGSGLVQVRSASRLGRQDFGVNRARIEQLRARLASAPG